ncbi:MAG TPA: sugar ABC transporter ATP-binding protein [Opitutales bacterium]|nr:sugar ABC transporter ATP-binding protein [Opitutales bacterium]
MEPLLAVKHLTKRFGGTTALKAVSFDLYAGEIHALCGENGAGKSTLIKTLSGIHPAGSFEGAIQVNGKPVHFKHVADATAAGIAVIYQELALIPEMSVAENIFLGQEPRVAGFMDWKSLYNQARTLLQRFDLSIDPEALVSSLGVGQQQMVEIIKALQKKSRILILDEPTAALAEHEVIMLMKILKELKAQGIACIYISHKLEEVMDLADRISVLRDGQMIATRLVHETTQSQLIHEMVGREIQDLYPKCISAPGDALLKVDQLTVAPYSGKPAMLKHISFEVRAGEVLGIGGLMGAGRTELLLHLFGVWGDRVTGTVTLDGHELSAKINPNECIRRGLVLVSEDRRQSGLVFQQSIGFNLSLSSLKDVVEGGIIERNREFARNRSSVQSLSIKAPSLESFVDKLSGGNQQKVVLGKALLTTPHVIFLDEPTRGIDVGAKVEVYELINHLTEQGKAVVLVSSELPELVGMSDRIVMLHEGQVQGEFLRNTFSPEKLMAAAMGQDASL